MVTLIITLVAWVGGSLYLLNKYFFLAAELNPARADEYRIWSWQVYLAGLLPWLLLFILKRDYIAFTVEALGSFSMLLGLLEAKGVGEKPAWLESLSFLTIPVVAAVAVSAYLLDGIGNVSQWLEAALAVGFVVGTRRLAKKRFAEGYRWYLLMNGANTALMAFQDQWVLAVQQVLSIIIILAALHVRRTR